jgi:hypothetical protein
MAVQTLMTNEAISLDAFYSRLFPTESDMLIECIRVLPYSFPPDGDVPAEPNHMIIRAWDTDKKRFHDKLSWRRCDDDSGS